MGKRFTLKTSKKEEKKEGEVGDVKKEIAGRLAPVLYSQVVDFCVSYQRIPEPGMLVIGIRHVEGIERVPLRSALYLYDSRPGLPPFAGNQEFCNAVYEGTTLENGEIRYLFRINPGSRMLSMLRLSTRRIYDENATELIFADNHSDKKDEPCSPPVKRACKEVKIKHQTLEEELSGRPNLELET